MSELKPLPFGQFMEKLTDINGQAWNGEEGVHSYIYEFGIEMPVELEIGVNEDGTVTIGSTPPLYYVDTTFKPSYHAIRFTAIKFEPPYGNTK